MKLIYNGASRIFSAIADIINRHDDKIEAFDIKTLNVELNPSGNHQVTLPKTSSGGYTASYNINSYPQVTALLDDGYKAMLVFPTASGSNLAYWYNCTEIDSSGSFTIQIKSLNANQMNVTPRISFVMVKGFK